MSNNQKRINSEQNSKWYYFRGDCKEHPAILLKKCGKKHSWIKRIVCVGWSVSVNGAKHKAYCPKCFPQGCPNCKAPEVETKEFRNGDRMANKRITGKLRPKVKGNENG